MYRYLGITQSQCDPSRREIFRKMFLQKIELLLKYIPFDETADALSQKFYHEKLPPVKGKKKKKKRKIVPTDTTRICLVERDVLRITNGENHNITLVYSAGNSRRYIMKQIISDIVKRIFNMLNAQNSAYLHLIY